jgi:hypothetical protein
MHEEEHGKEKEARLKNYSFFCLYRTRIRRSVIEKSASTLAVGCKKSCLMYMDCKGSKIGVYVNV